MRGDDIKVHAYATSGPLGPLAGGFRDVPVELPPEVVKPDKERDPAPVIRSLVNRLKDCGEEVDRYYERYGPLDED